MLNKIMNLFRRNENEVGNENEEYTSAFSEEYGMTKANWERHYNTQVVGIEGFPENFNEHDIMTQRQFLEAAENSTVLFNEAIMNDFKILQIERHRNLA